MRGNHTLFALLATVAVGLTLALPVQAAHRDALGRYVVVLKATVPSAAVVAKDHAAKQGAQVQRVYESALKGYAAIIPQSRLAAIRADSRVSYVETDRA